MFCNRGIEDVSRVEPRVEVDDGFVEADCCCAGRLGSEVEEDRDLSSHACRALWSTGQASSAAMMTVCGAGVRVE